MSATAFELSNISRQYPHFALQDMNLSLPKGEIMGLIGPNGAGKSTTIRILMGLVKPDSGSVSVLGHAVPEQQVEAKYGVGYASEDMRLYKQATVQWHMEFVRKVYLQQWDQGYAESLLKRFDVLPQQKVKGLSHGQRVKTGLLLILARRPDLLILDEPTTGLDPVARKEVLNELIEVMADDDRSILFSSHNTQDVEQLSDHITFIDRGKVVSSHDKESYVESWRRMRLRWDSDKALPKHQGITETFRNGQSVVLTIKQADEEVKQLYQQAGADIQSIERMSLEEIFVAEVESSRVESI
ncbi:ABC transporter ATP-binding protein [Marinicella sp. W31]|uniref:ABC transporter ATP-binding protein n=1 Tax=Marinicella sp. W31 TaxID=3023713 RepID=UPI003756DA61